MKLSKLYVNAPASFPDIAFHDGLNVIFAQVKDYKVTDTDAHNLGKTFLIRVIDFCLLGGADKAHPFSQHPDRFAALTFYIEVVTVDGIFVTIKRPVTGARAISINTSKESSILRGQGADSWEHRGLGIEKAKSILNDYLGLDALKPYGYRKGLSYFLRRQEDYRDVFRISKFSGGKDVDWKPFMALMLGFDGDLVESKYRVEQTINESERELQALESTSRSDASSVDELRGRILALSTQVEGRREELERFSFTAADREITAEMVSDLESQVREMNLEFYRLSGQARELENALSTDLQFNLDRIRQLFEETKLYFPEGMLKDYQDLITFNEQMTASRKGRLRTTLEGVTERKQSLASRIDELDKRRSESLSALKEQESLKRFRQLQLRLLKDEEALLGLESQLRQLDVTSDRRQRIRELRTELARISEAIEEMVLASSVRYDLIRKQFTRLSSSIAKIAALITVSVNGAGNLSFEARVVKDPSESISTSEGEGTSYRKLLCVCFDLALLCAYSQSSFYRFVYHDGVFEGLDDRRKLSMLEQIRSLCEQYNLQYILTVIDSDLPRNADDNKLFFKPSEVIRTLSDEGDCGRLFPGPPF